MKLNNLDSLFHYTVTMSLEYSIIIKRRQSVQEGPCQCGNGSTYQQNDTVVEAGKKKSTGSDKPSLGCI
jgi:hypothetical protein